MNSHSNNNQDAHKGNTNSGQGAMLRALTSNLFDISESLLAHGSWSIPERKRLSLPGLKRPISQWK